MYGLRKRARAKTSIKNRRRIMRRKPTAINQKRQILSNQNQIVALKRHVNLGKERCRWHMGIHKVSITAYPMIIPLTSGPSSSVPATTNTTVGHNCGWNVTMTPQPQKNQFSRSKVVVNSQWVDMSIYSANEADLVQHTAFLVQLREDCARQTYQETNSMTALTRGDDYATTTDVAGADTGYGAYLNTDKFKILKRLEFETAGALNSAFPDKLYPSTTGNTGSGTNAFQVKRCQFKVNYGNTVLKAAGDAGSLSTLEYNDIPSTHKRFIVLFSDNSTVDLEDPKVSVSSLITGYSVE